LLDISHRGGPRQRVAGALHRVWVGRRLRTQGIVVLVVPLAVLLGLLAVGLEIDALLSRGAAGGGTHLLVVGQLMVAVSVVILVAGMVGFTRGLANRLALLATNAERLARNLPLLPVGASSEEVGRLAAGLEQTAHILGRQAADLRSALRAAEQASQAKGDFLSRVSHELRTPLNAVLGFGQLLDLEEDLSVDEQEAVDHILRAGRHLLNLIDELLDVAQTGGGEVERDLEPILATDVFREALALVGPLAQDRGVLLHGEGLAKSDGLFVMADHQRLLQVLLNLLSNAVKYNHSGGRVIADCASIDGDLVRLEVTDSGSGIDLKDLDRLFTPFDRLGAEQTEVEGTGIGLSLTLSLIEAMGGSIAVDSAVGVGSTFAVDLKSAEDLPITQARSRRFGPERRSLSGTLPSARGTVERRGRILYIEDNAPNFDLVQRILADHQMLELIGATTGRAGCRMALHHSPDLVLLDLQLPDMAGLEVLAHLRADPRTREVPVIVISADATQGSRSDLAAAGVVDYLTKPIELVSLLECIDHALDPYAPDRHVLDRQATRSI
jgi:signal transduction histidine kinase/AmiR/NasT family two-component response regulator